MTEKQLTRSIMKALRDKGAWCFKVAGGPFQVAGIPDIIGCYRGRFFAFEVKGPGGRATVLQDATIRAIRSDGGGSALVVRSVEDAIGALERGVYEWQTADSS